MCFRRTSTLVIACALLLLISTIGTTYGQPTSYDQQYRPQVHFSPQKNWTNDPNGLVYYRGEYHLFFQYNPFGDKWGHMSWGHAVSSDLLHWQELPVAIPERGDTMIFTGSVVVDRNNTSGFCDKGSDCLVAIYTGHKQTGQTVRQAQYLSYSLDRGRTWKEYAGNPVIDLNMADFRDPSVFWEEDKGRWVMAVSLPKEHKVRLYSSANLRQWRPLSDFGPAGDTDGDWECPDLLRIPAANGNGSVWAMKVGLNPGAPQGGSGEQYFIGTFDGTKFIASSDAGSHGWTNYGKDDYCAISFNGIPKGEKPVLLGWMNNWQYAADLPTTPWRGQMSIPRRLSSLKDNAGIALKQEPVIDALRAGVAVATISRDQTKTSALETPYEFSMQFEGSPQGKFGLRIIFDDQHWTEIAFDPQRKEFRTDRTKSGAEVTKDFPTVTRAHLVSSRPSNLRVIVDRSSIEVFAQDGTIAMTNLIFPPTTKSRIEVFWADGKKHDVRGKVWKLKSIWK